MTRLFVLYLFHTHYTFLVHFSVCVRERVVCMLAHCVTVCPSLCVCVAVRIFSPLCASARAQRAQPEPVSPFLYLCAAAVSAPCVCARAWRADAVAGRGAGKRRARSSPPAPSARGLGAPSWTAPAAHPNGPNHAALSDRKRARARTSQTETAGTRASAHKSRTASARAHRHKRGLRNDDLTPAGGRGHSRHPGSTGPAGPWFDSDVTAGTRT